MEDKEDRKALYRLFYLWAYAPQRFFIGVIDRFKEKRDPIQILYVSFSFLFPLLGGTLLFTFIVRFAVIDIAENFLPKSLIWFILVFFFFLLDFVTLLFIPGFSLKYQLKHQNYGNIRMFSRISVLRNNLFQLPIVVVLIIVNITLFRSTWKIYTLGIYLAIVMIIIFLWVTLFQVSSLTSIRAQLHVDKKRKRIIPFYQFGFKAIWSTVLFTAFCFALDFALGLWLGASEMSLWSKLAMLILHGN